MHSFDQAKAQLQLQAVAERYTGQTAQRGKMCCPFHPDAHPSMQLKNERYRCYVCDAHGDAIDFTARLFHESQAAALTRLAADFALHLPDWNATHGVNAPNNPNNKNARNRLNKAQTPAARKQAAEDIAARKQAAEKAAQAVAEWRQQQALAAAFLQWEDATYTALADMHRTVRDWRRDWAPTEPNTLAALDGRIWNPPLQNVQTDTLAALDGRIWNPPLQNVQTDTLAALDGRIWNPPLQNVQTDTLAALDGRIWNPPLQNVQTDTLAALDGRIWNPPLRDLCESPSCRGRFHIVPRRGSQDIVPEQTETPDQCNKQNEPDAPQHPRYLFAIRELDWLRYLLDTLLESEENRINFYKNIKIRKEVYALTEEFERLAHPNRTSRIAEPEHCDAS